MKEDVVVKLRDNDQGIMENKIFQHKSFEKRLSEYNEKIYVRDFDWGEPIGKEFL